MFFKDAITNEILAYIIRKCTYVYVCLRTFCNRFFPPCTLGTPQANYSQFNISRENVANASVWGIIDLKGKKGLANRNNLNYTCKFVRSVSVI